jgi:mediator of RNA polymerase II transcription subunit 17
MANEEIGYALDSLSLLESKYIPAHGTKTMSTALKEAIPPGTLSYDKWNLSKQNPTRKHQQEAIIFKGSVLSTLSSSADSLLQAASRLEKDVKRETEYWDKVLSLTNAGYPVFKMPSDKRTLAVQFGAREAGPLFRERGIAALRANEDGTVKLNQSLTAKPKTTRLRILEDNKLVYTSTTTASSAPLALDTSLQNLVRQAQDSLFEEELFHEMVMESRDLQPLGVKLRENVIHIPLSARQDNTNQREALIDLVPLDEAQDTKNTTENDVTYDIIAVAFRLLLSHTYHKRLHRRSLVPPPLSERKRSTPPSSIIRPVMAVSQHGSAYHPLSDYLTRVSTNLKAAGIPIQFNSSQVTALSSLIRNLSTPPSLPLKQSSTLHTFLDTLTKPITNNITFAVPSAYGKDDPEGTIKIEISTNLSAPQLGTEYMLYLTKPLAKLMHGNDGVATKLPFDSATDLTSFIGAILSLDISRNVLLPKGIDGGWEHADGNPAISKVVQIEGTKRKLGIRLSVEAEEISVSRIWLGSMKEDGRESWDSSASKESLVQVVEGWIGEHAELEE